ncbi:hypothetical protein BDW22DRAFT_1428255 [Trametopsis cervina]|nr:hypothetical protein BDW22DRAFT_1428255 [Trametopsis cervina]
MLRFSLASPLRSRIAVPRRLIPPHLAGRCVATKATKELSSSPPSHQALMRAVQLETPKCVALVQQATPKNSLLGMIIHTDGPRSNGRAGGAAYIEVYKTGARQSVVAIIDIWYHLGEMYSSSDGEFAAVIAGLRCLAEMLRDGVASRSVVIASDFLEVCRLVDGKTGYKDPIPAKLHEILSNLRTTYPQLNITSRHTPRKAKVAGHIRADRTALSAAAGTTKVAVNSPDTLKEKKGTGDAPGN